MSPVMNCKSGITRSTDTTPAAWSDSVKAKPTRILGGQWNQYDIKAVGDHYVVVLNGTTILDAHDGKHAEGLVGFNVSRK